MTNWNIPILNRKFSIDSFMVDFPASHVTFRGAKIGVSQKMGFKSSNYGNMTNKGSSHNSGSISQFGIPPNDYREGYMLYWPTLIADLRGKRVSRYKNSMDPMGETDRNISSDPSPTRGPWMTLVPHVWQQFETSVFWVPRLPTWLRPWRLTAGTCPHGGLVPIIFLSKWVIGRFHVNLPGCSQPGPLP